MKHWLKRLHLTCALAAGFFLLNLAISAGLLLFAKDIMQLVQPQYWQTETAKGELDIPRTVSDILQLAEQQQRQVKQIQIDSHPDSPWLVLLRDGRQWNYDPANQRIIHRLDQGDDFYHWILHWHRWLLMGQNDGSSWARHVTASAALLLIVGIMLGYLMWLSRKSPIKRLRIKPLASRHGRFYQYHLLAGIFIGLPLLLIAFTGLSFNWSTQPIFEAATLSKMQERRNDKAVSVGGLDMLQASLQKAQKSLPEARFSRLYFPQSADQPLLIRMQYASERAPFSYVWLDAGSAELLSLYDSARAPAANDWWDFKYAFHSGLWLGKLTTWLWLVLMVGLSFLVVSGYYLYFKRRSQLRSKRATP